MNNKKKILFLCTHNAARSQIAEAFINARFGDRYVAHSAGIEPTEVQPCAIKVMAEIGIDITKQRAKSLSEFDDADFDYVVTMCADAAENCPISRWSELPSPRLRRSRSSCGIKHRGLRFFQIRARSNRRMDQDHIFMMIGAHLAFVQVCEISCNAYRPSLERVTNGNRHQYHSSRSPVEAYVYGKKTGIRQELGRFKGRDNWE
jgi:hypothetical protein